MATKLPANKASLAPGFLAHAHAAHEAGGTLMVLSFKKLDLEKYAGGCGSPIHISGTNGGTMPCGAKLTQFGETSQQFCEYCSKQKQSV